MIVLNYTIIWVQLGVDEMIAPTTFSRLYSTQTDRQYIGRGASLGITTAYLPKRIITVGRLRENRTRRSHETTNGNRTPHQLG